MKKLRNLSKNTQEKKWQTWNSKSDQLACLWSWNQPFHPTVSLPALRQQSRPSVIWSLPVCLISLTLYTPAELNYLMLPKQALNSHTLTPLQMIFPSSPTHTSRSVHGSTLDQHRTLLSLTFLYKNNYNDPCPAVFQDGFNTYIPLDCGNSLKTVKFYANVPKRNLFF